MNLKHTICFVDKLTTTSLLMVDNDLESLAGLEDSNDDDLDSLVEEVIVYLPDKIMFTGLVLVKYKRRRIKRAGGEEKKPGEVHWALQVDACCDCSSLGRSPNNVDRL
jgi:hypothetical protein